MKRIIYENQDGTIGILIPTPDCIDMLTAQAGYVDAALVLIAEKDVPHGLPYWIVDTAVIPADRTDRNQWRLDGSQGEPDGYGGESNEFPAEVLP